MLKDASKQLSVASEDSGTLLFTASQFSGAILTCTTYADYGLQMGTLRGTAGTH